ncbi:unnamed protein product, partial [Effrenium voratum]
RLEEEQCGRQRLGGLVIQEKGRLEGCQGQQVEWGIQERLEGWKRLERVFRLEEGGSDSYGSAGGKWDSSWSGKKDWSSGYDKTSYGSGTKSYDKGGYDKMDTSYDKYDKTYDKSYSKPYDKSYDKYDKSYDKYDKYDKTYVKYDKYDYGGKSSYAARDDDRYGRGGGYGKDQAIGCGDRRDPEPRDRDRRRHDDPPADGRGRDAGGERRTIVVSNLQGLHINRRDLETAFRSVGQVMSANVGGDVATITFREEGSAKDAVRRFHGGQLNETARLMSIWRVMSPRGGELRQVAAIELHLQAAEVEALGQQAVAIGMHDRAE